MTRIWILLLCLSGVYGQSGITLQQLEKALKASEVRIKDDIRRDIEELGLEQKADMQALNVRIDKQDGKIEGINGKIEGMKIVIDGMRYTVNLVLTAVIIMLTIIAIGIPLLVLFLGKRDREEASQNRAFSPNIVGRPTIRETVQVENGYLDEAKMQAIAEKVFREQANAIVEKALKEKAELQKV